MLASVSGILKEEMAPHLDAITQRMMSSLTSEEGVKVRISIDKQIHLCCFIKKMVFALCDYSIFYNVLECY